MFDDDYEDEPVLDLKVSLLSQGSFPSWAARTQNRAQEVIFDLCNIDAPYPEPPYISVINTRGDTIGGRYFPSRNAILAVVNHSIDPTGSDRAISRGLVCHEMAHWGQYLLRCGRQRTRCGYVGQHDRRFYRMVEVIYEHEGVPLDLAREWIENDCAGDYKCPSHW